MNNMSTVLIYTLNMKNDNVDAYIKIAQLVIISYIKCNNDMR